MNNIRSAPWRKDTYVKGVSEMRLEKAEKYRTGNRSVNIEDFYSNPLPVKLVKRSDYL
jgi:hypothetical protein